MNRVVLFAVTFVVVQPGFSQDDYSSILDRFELWHYCGSMDLVVENLNNDADDIGLTKDAIETSVRARLRAARLYDDEAFSNLYIVITVSGLSFSISVEYKKIVRDLASQEETYATTWNRRRVGTHGRDSNYVIQTLSQDIDIFIDEFLRVNEAACSDPGSYLQP